MIKEEDGQSGCGNALRHGRNRRWSKCPNLLRPTRVNKMENHTYHKSWILALFCLILLSGLPWQKGLAQKADSPPAISPPSGPVQDFVRSLCFSVSMKAAEMGFDYRARPVIGVVVADFAGPAGEEIELGNFIGYELRAALARGNQFHVYGKDHPVSQSLKADLLADPNWSAASQRAFQQNLWRKFKPFPVDLVITGRVSPEAGNRIKAVVKLIPFVQPITLVESESGRVGVVQEQFLSPSLQPDEVSRGLQVVQTPTKARGRLVILSSLRIKKSKYSTSTLPASGTAQAIIPESGLWEDTPVSLPETEFHCWLNDRELTMIKDWKEIRRKDYYNLLSGFEADAFWFDDMVEEGRHLLFFSLAQHPSLNRYVTFSESVTVTGGTSHYVYFFLVSDPYGEPQLRIRQVVDPKNQPLPF